MAVNARGRLPEHLMLDGAGDNKLGEPGEVRHIERRKRPHTGPAKYAQLIEIGSIAAEIAQPFLHVRLPEATAISPVLDVVDLHPDHIRRLQRSSFKRGERRIHAVVTPGELVAVLLGGKGVGSTCICDAVHRILAAVAE